jgi:inorganic pyrophosphatase
MNSRPVVPGCVVAVRPFGVLVMEDDKGADEKLLTVPAHRLTSMYDDVNDIGDVQPIQLERVKHFFTHYKDLEPGKWSRIHHLGNAEEARRIVLESIERAGRPPRYPLA